MNFRLLAILLITTTGLFAQENQLSSFNIGDVAPPLRLHEWIKGKPIQRFEKGNVYVLEFWATWCKPCIATMPHLSNLASIYKDKVRIIGIDIDDQKTTSIEKVKAFVDSMGNKLNYDVAVQDSNYMVNDWINASGETTNGIPNSFVIDAEGRIASIGHPKDLGDILANVVARKWDLKNALNRRNLNKYLEQLDASSYFEYVKYVGDAENPKDLGHPDSVLRIINEIVNKEPRLRYAPLTARHTFSSLLKTNSQEAYNYGKIILLTPTYQDPAYDAIINSVRWDSTKLAIPPMIYDLAAEAYQAQIDNFPEYSDTPMSYHKMAECYWRANNKSKAIDAEQKAIEAMKSQKNFSAKEMAIFESKLKNYKTL